MISLLRCRPSSKSFIDTGTWQLAIPHHKHVCAVLTAALGGQLGNSCRQKATAPGIAQRSMCTGRNTDAEHAHNAYVETKHTARSMPIAYCSSRQVLTQRISPCSICCQRAHLARHTPARLLVQPWRSALHAQGHNTAGTQQSHTAGNTYHDTRNQNCAVLCCASSGRCNTCSVLLDQT